MNTATENSKAALSVSDLHKRFDGTKAVDGVTFSISSGSIVSVIGPNGAGKTTVFNIISGLIAADSGGVVCGGHDVSSTPAFVRARTGIGRTFQEMRIVSRLTAIDNVMLADANSRGESPLGALLSRWGSEELRARQRGMEHLRELGLADSADVPAANLSYGQRKLLTVACACATGANVLLLDEPVAGVNPVLQARLLAMLQRLRGEEGRTIVIIEHNMDVVMRISDRVVVMCDGRVIADGPPGEVRESAAVIEAYLS